MKSSIKKRTFKAISRLLDKFSPVNGDCGLLCDCACCTCNGASNASNHYDEDDLGIYLLPGEHKIFTGKEKGFRWEKLDSEDYEFPDSWHGNVYFLQCLAAPSCNREIRPIQCRTFPLAPYLDEDEFFYMIYENAELPYECPLITEKIPLNENFIKATYTAWKHLLSDPLIYDLVEFDSVNRREENNPIEIVYP